MLATRLRFRLLLAGVICLVVLAATSGQSLPDLPSLLPGHRQEELVKFSEIHEPTNGHVDIQYSIDDGSKISATSDQSDWKTELPVGPKRRATLTVTPGPGVNYVRCKIQMPGQPDKINENWGGRPTLCLMGYPT